MEKAFIHGFVLAAGLIFPLGVQNLFVLQQGIVQTSFWRVLPAIITAASCDTILILLAVSSISLFMLQFVFLRTLLLSAGIVFLLYMGWVNWNSQPEADREKPQEGGRLTVRQQVLFAVSVSLLNPYALLDIIGVIGTSSLQYTGQEKLIFTLATISVSWFWFTLLGSLGRFFTSLQRDAAKRQCINRFSALFIWGTAIYLTFHLLLS